ncbi:hypothetical protein MBGDC06_00184 [Thermoplasmatales archaeon SCGC AB-539-C06]|nr:hypothetical protein MBGDC06_00184 [Thermoplasmatales archaeon SCGC AB-539-C06]
MLEVKDLKVKVENKCILDSISLNLKSKETTFYSARTDPEKQHSLTPSWALNRMK